MHIPLRPTFTVLCCAFIALSQLRAQNALHCGTDLFTEQLYLESPGLREREYATQQDLAQQAGNRMSTPPTYIIPVVFHVIHNYGTENISDAQILDAVAILNEDFRKLNADTSQIVSPFDTIAADCEIEFRLAHLDPHGNCTNGIDRIASVETNVGDAGSKLNQWPRDQYLNIWVVKNIPNGVAGYALYPYSVSSPSMAHLDGIMVRSDFVGSIGTSAPSRSRTITHDAGHWLGLAHPGGLCLNSDMIADTPVTNGWSTCQLTNNDVCNPGIAENVQNFMEYNICRCMFTRGQRDFMHAALNSTISGRNNLWTGLNLTLTGVNNSSVTCIPHADFKINRRMVCQGTSITLTDLSWNGNIASWIWKLTGPDTLTSAFQNPSFVMNIPGSYDIQLIASNAAGADTITKVSFLTVSTTTATLNSTYSESFEMPNVFSLGYITRDGYGNGSYFMQTQAAGHTGTSSVIRPFGNSLEGDVDELITPSYYLSYNSNLQFSFVYAYVTADTTPSANTAILKLWSSVDCGQSWAPRWLRTGPSLETADFMTGNFVPSGPADWDTVVINLSNATAASNVRFKFEFTAPYDAAAGNLYIDDINILASNVGIMEQPDADLFSIYPNPGDGNSTIAYTLNGQSVVQAELYDISGRLVRTIYRGEQAAGNYTLQVGDESNPLAPGTYMIRMMIGDKVSTRQYIVTGLQ